MTDQHPYPSPAENGMSYPTTAPAYGSDGDAPALAGAPRPGDVSPREYADAVASFEPTPSTAPLAGTRRDMPARVIPHRAKASLDEWAQSADRVPVFTVQHDDGSHTTYTMPAKPNPGVAIGFLRDIRRQGDAALIGLFETVLDEGAVDALVDELSAMDADEAAGTMAAISERVQRNLGGNIKR